MLEILVQTNLELKQVWLKTRNSQVFAYSVRSVSQTGVPIPWRTATQQGTWEFWSCLSSSVSAPQMAVTIVTLQGNAGKQYTQSWAEWRREGSHTYVRDFLQPLQKYPVDIVTLTYFIAFNSFLTSYWVSVQLCIWQSGKRFHTMLLLTLCSESPFMMKSNSQTLLFCVILCSRG